MTGLALLLLIATATGPLVQVQPSVWEMDVDKPSLQVNYHADAVRGMRSGLTCRLGRKILEPYGGRPRGNDCSLALEMPSGTAYFAYCDARTSYLVQIDLHRCKAEEVAELRNQRLTGTAVLDTARDRVWISSLAGTYIFQGATTSPIARLAGVPIYSKHEFFSDAKEVYLLDTTFPEPRLNRVDIHTLVLTRVRLGDVSVVDFRAGKLLLRGKRDRQAFGLYDARKRTIVQRWRGPVNMAAYFVGDGWVAFWSRPSGVHKGELVLVNAVSGESVYYGQWSGKKPPTIAWKGRTLYVGSQPLLITERLQPVPSPIRRVASKHEPSRRPG